MNREQKRALAIVISLVLSVLLAVAAVMMSRLHLRGLSLLLLVSVVVVSCGGVVTFFRLRPRQGTVLFDERDREIQRNASLAAFGNTFLLVSLASFVPSFILGENASIPVTWLPPIVAGAGAFYAAAFFLSVVIQYGRGGDHGQ